MPALIEPTPWRLTCGKWRHARSTHTAPSSTHATSPIPAGGPRRCVVRAHRKPSDGVQPRGRTHEAVPAVHIVEHVCCAQQPPAHLRPLCQPLPRRAAGLHDVSALEHRFVGSKARRAASNREPAGGATSKRQQVRTASRSAAYRSSSTSRCRRRSVLRPARASASPASSAPNAAIVTWSNPAAKSSLLRTWTRHLSHCASACSPCEPVLA